MNAFSRDGKGNGQHVRAVGYSTEGSFCSDEDVAFTTLFTLDDVAVTVRAEANTLLFSTIELLAWTVATPLSRTMGSEFARKLLHADTRVVTGMHAQLRPTR
ncbi:hypothetical protein CYMTET_38682 [Cymbomonas tetramitiformis]|uniref:Uncharacterized protein n=1 Tax=Cymbomonas tetramitiformis TaxID=36881 RepID=A0AAE0EWZ3_9CHLO|nr:hypothetical protein CYMTET_46536 [Cymbomonas tetramitiformis]KAK3243831.1 hypothetical protein CYMTET_46535 [Cymbomonas tetramitiformis]KAK3252005.1 hypothetical protein CYMTET_38682 [Cymbomonas tetramitiformis]